MPPRRSFVLAASLGLLSVLHPLSAQAWDISFGSDTLIVGSGKLIEQVRTPGKFERLRLDGSFDVTLGPGSTARVLIRADDNIAALIQTELDGDTLVIKARKNSAFRTRNPIAITVDFTQLKAVDLRGSGKLSADTLQGDRFDLALSGSGNAVLKRISVGQFHAALAGSGDISVSGKADSTDLSIAGSGDIHAEQLISRQTSVSIAGSGDADVYASESLSASIAGSGDVRYAGKPPKVSRSVVGSGDVSPR
jgi:hypothetical protein